MELGVISEPNYSDLLEEGLIALDKMTQEEFEGLKLILQILLAKGGESK